MVDIGNKIYRFKSFRLNVGERQLFDSDGELVLTPKAFDVLVYLVENAGHLVHKEELMKAVWPDSFVEEVNVARAVHHLRKALGQGDEGNRFIETVPTKGYRFIAAVESYNGTADRLAQPDAQTPDTGEEPEGPDRPAEPYGVKAGIGRSGRKWFIAFGCVSALFVLGAVWYGGGISTSKAGASGDRPETRNSGAYRLYLEGKLILDLRHGGDGEAARAKFEEAIQLDPNFALAYAGRADAEWRVFLITRTLDDIARTRASINKALSLDPDNSYAHTVQCRVYMTFDWDFPAAETACRRAVELDPKSPDAHYELAMLLSLLGRHDEALAAIDTAVKLAPSSSTRNNRAIILFHARRYAEAIEEISQVIADDPDFPPARHWLWWYYAMNRDYDHAVEAYLAWRKYQGQTDRDEELRSIYSTEGWTGFENAILRDYRPPPAAASYPVAALHCQLGDKDKAFEILESDLKIRTLWMAFLKADPRFDPCRDDPRFDSIVRRVGQG
jgi:DNA-binding winged helix-turn-helix (wHTH) protein/Tfp pilus assembly protein PilF